MLVEFRDSHLGQTLKYQSWLDTDMGTIVEGLIDDEAGTSKEEPMEDSEGDPAGLTKDDLFMGLTEALAGDAAPVGPTSTAASISELECRVQNLTFEILHMLRGMRPSRLGMLLLSTVMLTERTRMRS